MVVSCTAVAVVADVAVAVGVHAAVEDIGVVGVQSSHNYWERVVMGDDDYYSRDSYYYSDDDDNYCC